MPTIRELVLAAPHARLQLLAALTLRDEVLPERIPAAGLIILRDGQPGDPEFTLSPLRYHYQHRAEFEVVVQTENGTATAFDTFVADQRNVVLVGGTGTGKSHLAIAIARTLIRKGTRGRFYNVVDLVNRLETETRSGKQGRLVDYLNRLDFPPRENDPPDRFLILVDPR
jgi:hypothetical protein